MVTSTHMKFVKALSTKAHHIAQPMTWLCEWCVKPTCWVGFPFDGGQLFFNPNSVFGICTSEISGYWHCEIQQKAPPSHNYLTATAQSRSDEAKERAASVHCSSRWQKEAQPIEYTGKCWTRMYWTTTAFDDPPRGSQRYCQSTTMRWEALTLKIVISICTCPNDKPSNLNAFLLYKVHSSNIPQRSANKCNMLWMQGVQYWPMSRVFCGTPQEAHYFATVSNFLLGLIHLSGGAGIVTQHPIINIAYAHHLSSVHTLILNTNQMEKVPLMTVMKPPRRQTFFWL